MTPYRRIPFVFLAILISIPSWADTFKHRTTGETFTGFRTHRKSAGKVLVFNAEKNQSVPMDLSEYEITRDNQGRRDSVMLIRLEQPEVLVSEAVAQEAASMILKAADQGPKGIIIQIDLPGGQGGPMRQIAEAITTAADNTGTRVAAFVSGGQYGGAFSAAAIVALACEKIYISPTAAMGAVGPLGTAGTKTNEEYLQMLETYAPDSLSSFSVYAATLAQRGNRPELLAQAFIDKHLTIAEVRTPDGKSSIVEISRRQENQAVVRTIAEGLPETLPSGGSPLRSVGKLLSVPSAEAVRWKLADKQAASLSEVLSDMGLSEVPIVNVAGLSSTIQKFTTAKKNLEQLLAKIQAQEDRVSTLENHLNTLEEMAVKSTVTREVTRGGQYENYRRGTVRLIDSDRLWDRYYNERDAGNTDIPLQDRYGREITTRDRSGLQDREKITEQQPTGNIPEIRRQLIAVTSEMIADYQRAIGLARRWPGALPAGISLETLQKNLLSAQTLLTIQQRRLMQGY